MKAPNRVTLLNEDQTIINGINKYFKGQSISLDGTTLPASDWVKKYQDHYDLTQAADAAHEKWRSLVAQVKATRKPFAKLRTSLKQQVKNSFGVGSEAYAAFGFKLPKQTKLTVDTKVVAVQKTKTTRAGRTYPGTKKAKAKPAPTTPGVPGTPKV